MRSQILVSIALCLTVASIPPQQALAADAVPATMVGKWAGGDIKAGRLALGGAAKRAADWAANRLVKNALAEIAARASMPNNQGELYEIEVYFHEQYSWVHWRFVGSGPTMAEAYRNSLSRPSLRAEPPPAQRHTEKSQLVFFGPGGKDRKPQLTLGGFGEVLKQQVEQQFDAQQAAMRAAAEKTAVAERTRERNDPEPNATGRVQGQISPGPTRNAGRPEGPILRSRPDGLTLVDRNGVPIEFGVAAGRAWADFDGDGNDDYCRVRADGAPFELLVTLSNGSKFENRAAGKVIITQKTEVGFPDGRQWIYFDGDRKADFARVVGIAEWVGSTIALLNLPAATAATAPRLQVSLSTGTDLGRTISSGPIDAGIPASRFWADWDGDGISDFLRIVGDRNFEDAALAVTFGRKDGFGETVRTAGRFDWGYEDSRLWIDINGDGKMDFVRVVGDDRDLIAITLSNGHGFAATTVEALETELPGRIPGGTTVAPMTPRSGTTTRAPNVRPRRSR